MTDRDNRDKQAIVVFGSINMDLVVRAPRLPAPGETLTGVSFLTSPGGKGANQAVACARLGAATRLIGRLGDDVFGGTLREGLRADGVDVTGVATSAGMPSGVALITVDEGGENTIVVVPGANGAMGEADATRLDGALEDARVLLVQLEVPLDAVVAAAQAARRRGITLILDPAPARPLPPALYAATDIITPNETEAATLTGIPTDSRDGVRRAARALVERGARGALIKMGHKGVYWDDGRDGHFWDPVPVTATDTVAAGDAFNGALAVAVAEGRPFDDAIRWGLAAGACAVTKAGAQPSMPTREDVMGLVP